MVVSSGLCCGHCNSALRVEFFLSCFNLQVQINKNIGSSTSWILPRRGKKKEDTQKESKKTTTITQNDKKKCKCVNKDMYPF